MTNMIEQKKPVPRGRGALENPTGRFEKLDTSKLPQELDGQLQTELYKDSARSIISTNDSPDIGMSTTINTYRGCEHGCIYCYARPGHEYLGLSAGIDFETKLFVKHEGPQLLRKALAAKSWQPQVITMSGVTDCYQPSERRLKLTRKCLQVLAEFRNPVAIITKNALVTRDIDILSEMAQYQCAQVFVSITTLDKHLARVMEPRASRPELRLDAVHQLSAAGIPVGVMMAPIVPGLTEHEIPSLLKAAKEAGARSVGYTMLRLPYGVKDLFQTWLGEHYPDRKMKVLNRIREMRGGKLNDANFGSRMRGQGVHAELIADIFRKNRRSLGLDKGFPSLSTAHFRRVEEAQMSLF